MKKSQSSDYINGLEKTLAIGEEGIKLIGGLEPVFTDKFKLQDNSGIYNCTLIDYGEFKGAYIHILYFDFDNGSSQTIGFGTYNVDDNGVSSFDIYGISVVDQEFQIVSLLNRNPGTVPTYTSIATRP